MNSFDSHILAAHAVPPRAPGMPHRVALAIRGDDGRVRWLRMPVRVVFCQRALRRRIFEQTGILLPRLAPAEWSEKLESLLAVEMFA